ncbi:hypothetical protein [Actinomyces sp. MRS3W]|uniref:hypothetical protein n=1 Tax=Actinomyces sp. MRS3W TaxID=2800796 RepID=UPI0028FD64D3|nr:hypothetical protein [Actinomyces sp. MRS3W]MDU0349321.1 hypothetical protein [Actinomyces sp. MRS3W]
MSEYFAGKQEDPTGVSPSDDAQSEARAGQPAAGSRSRGRHVAPPPPEHVRFGVPFNGIIPLWHDGTDITWHRPVDDVDFAAILGLGHVETEPGPSTAPDGWQERVETGTLLPAAPDAETGPILRLRAISPSGRRAINDAGDGAPIRLSPSLSVQEAMGSETGGLDLTAFSIHIARLMLRAARDGAILLFTLRAPRDPDAHHLLSVPSEVDSRQVMHFHLGTLLDMTDGEWARAGHSDNMTLLDLDVPYQRLLGSPGAEGGQGLEVERLMDMAQPVVDCLLRPGFPFALGCSVILPVGRSR